MQRCYLCNHPTKVFLRARNRSILRCNNCKLTYTKDAAFDGAIQEDSEKFVKEYWKEKALYEAYFDTIIKTISKYKKPQTLLDVGCNIGIFLQSVKKVGWKGEGVDMSSSAVKYARSTGLKVHLGKIEDLKFPPQSLDVITLFQTIEHIEDPAQTLRKLYSLLRKGGILVITTPNEESLMAKILGKFWFGYRNVEHLYFFNKESLAKLQKKVGFEKIVIHTENGRVLSVSWVLTRIFEYYYNYKFFPITLVLKTKPFWKYLYGIRFQEPSVNLVSIAVK